MSELTLIALTTFGLEAVVKQEIMQLGYKISCVVDGRVEFLAELKDIPKLNLWLRVADRVVIKIAEFNAADFDELFDQTKGLNWDQWIEVDGKMTVVAKSSKSKLEAPRAIQSIVKKAIIEQLKGKYHKEWFEESGPEFVVSCAMSNNRALITLDTTGVGLHKRGYRTQTGEVPLRENLAAALVLLSFWNKKRMFIDPMCGSGTILIEAAMMGCNRAPGLNREFISENWSCFDSQDWLGARQAALEAVDSAATLNLRGYDVDERRIEDSKNNARNAGVDDLIEFQQKDIKDLVIEDEYGIMITNPPYGIKLASDEDLKPIYRQLSNVFKHPACASSYVLTADKSFPQSFNRGKPDRTRKLFSGNIEVNYYQYYGKKPKDN